MATHKDRQRQPGKALLGFNGELLEAVTGHYLLGSGYRAYSTVLLCFLQPDSWSPFGAGGFNAYAYCAGDPVNSLDPTGHMPFPTTRPWNSWRLSPPPSPPLSRPGSPVQVNEQASQLLTQALEQGASARSPLARSSSTSLSSSPPSSPSPVSAQARTASQAPRGPLAGMKKLTPEEIKEVQGRIDTLVDQRDAAGIIELAGRQGQRTMVLQQLFRKLPVHDDLWIAAMQRGESPVIKREHLWRLATDAVNARNHGDTKFFMSLYGFVHNIRQR